MTTALGKKNQTVLIVEDDPEDRSLFIRLLRRTDLDLVVLEAANAQRGLELYSSEKPECVLLDYRLPGLDGFWFLKKLTDDLGEHVPIIIITGAGDESLAVEAIKMGAQDYLLKDTLTSDNLHRAISHGIERTALKRRIEEKRLEALSSKKELEQFAYVTVKDIQKPLQKIASLCDRLITGNNPDKVIREVNMVSDEVTTIQKLLNNFSALSRIEADSMNFAKVDLTDIVKLAVSNLSNHILATKGNIEVGKLPVIEADAGQIYQLFHSIFSFELTYHSKEKPLFLGIKGKIFDPKKVEPQNTHSNEIQCQIILEDGDLKIDRDPFKEQFVPAYARKDREKNQLNSIDLILCQRIVEGHHGQILVHRGQKNSFSIIITLPVEQPT